MRIGIYRTCGIGDAVQLTPLFRQIRADFSSAQITFFTSENVAAIVEGCTLLNETVTFPSRLTMGVGAEWGGFPLWHRISLRGRWDVFLDLEPRWRRSVGFSLVRATRKGGVQSAGWKPLRLFDEFLPQHPLGLDLGHASARYLELWQKLTGHSDRGFGYDLQSLLDSPGTLPDLPARFVSLVPGAGNPMHPGEGKRWPIGRWRQLAEHLAGIGFEPVWLGSPDDAQRFPMQGAGLNLMGRLDLRQTCKAIARGVALVGNDSGLFHVALATPTKAVGLFGPTNPQRTGPFRNPNSLVMKAGLGRVDPVLLHTFTPGALQDALDAATPMEVLDFESVATEVTRFLAAATNFPSDPPQTSSASGPVV